MSKRRTSKLKMPTQQEVTAKWIADTYRLDNWFQAVGIGEQNGKQVVILYTKRKLHDCEGKGIRDDVIVKVCGKLVARGARRGE